MDDQRRHPGEEAEHAERDGRQHEPAHHAQGVEVSPQSWPSIMHGCTLPSVDPAVIGIGDELGNVHRSRRPHATIRITISVTQ